MKEKIVVFLLYSLLLILVYSIFIFSSIKYLQANPLAFAVYYTIECSEKTFYIRWNIF